MMPYTVHLPLVMRDRRSIPLGCCIHPSRFENPFYVPIMDHYQIITPEVAGGYWWVAAHGWADMDWIYQYAQDTGKQLIGYPLRWCYGEQPPEPLEWITEVMTRYPLITDWIVVNEGWKDGVATLPLIRESYLRAREVRPGVRLQYNGVFCQSLECDQVLGLIDDGLVDAVGIQCHHDLLTYTGRYVPLVSELNKRGIPWRVSELDVQIRDMSDESLRSQAEQYGDVVELVRYFGGESISTWGVGDWDSWKAEYYPLPLDWEYLPKPAWRELTGE